MSAQHKRPGRTAKLKRICRAKEREINRQYREQVVVLFPTGKRRYDGFPGRVVAVGVPPGEIA